MVKRFKLRVYPTLPGDRVVDVGPSIASGAQIAMQHARVVAVLKRAEEMEREEATTVQMLQTVRQNGLPLV